MSETEQHGGWKPGKRDLIFMVVVVTVILVLAFGSSERTVKPTPNDETHASATSRASCKSCHGPDGVKPQPPRHTVADQCFQCHKQPEAWSAGK